MNKFAVALVLISAIIIAGCVQGTSPAGNNTTGGEKIKIAGNVKFAGESSVRESLNKSEAVKLFLGIYPAAALSLTKAGTPYPMWVASYISGGKNLTINLNATTGEIDSSNIPIAYLKNGKYCKTDADCVNIGDLYGAMCVNYIYAAKDGTPCDGSKVGCGGKIQCCYCSIDWCMKKEISLSTAQCPASNTSSGTGSNSSAGSSSAASSVSCSSIKELTAGQKAVSGSKTLEFNGVYEEQGGVYSAKFTVKSESDSGTKYIKIKTSDYIAAGITLSVSDVIVPVGNGNAIAVLAISGMGDTCTIGAI